MVKVDCCFCRNAFEASIDEIWVCPNCDQAGNSIFNVISVSDDEIDRSLELLQRPGGTKQNINKIIGSNDYIFFGEYHNEENIKDSMDLLVLLFDKIIVKDKLLLTFYDELSSLGNFENQLYEKWVVPITGFGGIVSYEDKYRKYCIDHFKIIDHVVWKNLTKVLASEYLKQLKGKPNRKDFITRIAEKSEMGDPMFPGETFMRLLDFNFEDQIMISQLDSPSFIQSYQTDMMNCYFGEVTEIRDKELGRNINVFRDFIKRLGINIPLKVEFDELKQFRNEKTAKELRTTLFDITNLNREASDTDIVNDLTLCFNEKLAEFNEAVESFSYYRTGLLVGMVSTIGGLLGGVEGAIVGGLGSSSSMFFGDTIFKKYYQRNNKDWAYFLWKWKKNK